MGKLEPLLPTQIMFSVPALMQADYFCKAGFYTQVLYLPISLSTLTIMFVFLCVVFED